MNKMKYVGVNFSDGNYYLIPCSFIAEHRTEYYSKVDNFKKGSKEWDEEFEHSMSDNEISDWMSNNMNWSDVKDVALLDKSKENKINYEKEWCNVDYEFVER